MFIGEWSDENLKFIVIILKCFHLAPGLKINFHKSQVLGVGVPRIRVVQAAASIGCAVMQGQFRYLGVMVGESMSRHMSWVDFIAKLRSRLSNWKVKTLSIGGRLTLLKLILGASLIYNMSLYKAPRGVLKSMEAIRSRFFNGADSSEKKITWVWRFVSQDGSLWCRVIQAIYGSSIDLHPTNLASNWCSIVRELSLIKDNGFPRLFALELDKDILVAAKLGGSVVVSFRRNVQDGVERSQLSDLFEILEAISLSSDQDSWICDLFEDGEFHVKEVRNILDELILPSHLEPTRWVKYVPITINVFAWRARRDCLPTRSNLIHRGVVLDSAMCPLCQVDKENIDHILFQCDLAKIVFRKICCWWELIWQDLLSYSEWSSWFSNIRLPAKVKAMLEGVFYVAWWNVQDGVERSQLSDLFEILEAISLLSDQDSWICDLSEDGEFHVKE
nr:RNA-directed DNA polymerase, eukaryota [Tanacetum cinerariifolium]